MFFERNPKISNSIENPRNLLKILDKENDRIFELNDENCMIGRKSGDAMIPGQRKSISHKHCKTYYKGNGYYIKDKHSINGTYVLIDNSGLYPQNQTEIKVNSYDYKMIMMENYLIFEQIDKSNEKQKKPAMITLHDYAVFIYSNDEGISEVLEGNQEKHAVINIENGHIKIRPLMSNM